MKFYYLSYSKEQVLEYNNYYDTIERKGIRLEYDDYPTHRHRSVGFVQIMELIPEKRIMTVKWLYTNRYLFSSMELDKNQIFKEDGKYYLTEFEKEHNTEVYRSHYKIR